MPQTPLIIVLALGHEIRNFDKRPFTRPYSHINQSDNNRLPKKNSKKKKTTSIFVVGLR